MTIEVVVAPTKYKLAPEKVRLFLAGSIEQGTAEMWHSRVIDSLVECSSANDIQIFNPRRESWDSTWPQDPAHKEFNEQVNWELGAISDSDVVFFWFDKNTRSPITLLELGLCLADLEKHTIVFCPPEFWRYGNVKITCDQYGVACHQTADDAINELKNLFKKPHKRYFVD